MRRVIGLLSWLGFGPRASGQPEKPTVDTGRCVHALLVGASCRRCAAACPNDAWSFVQDDLVLDPNRCDGCGLCVSVCPQDALSQPYAPALRVEDHSAFAACQRVGVIGEDGVIPCVHGIGEQDLYALAERGVHVLRLARENCDECARGGKQRMDHLLPEVNDVLQSRRVPPVEILDLPFRQWHRALQRAVQRETLRPDRRRFLGLGRADAGTDAKPGEAPDGSRRSPLSSSRLPEADAALFPWVPEILAERCVACDACLHLCPTGALAISEAASAYRMDAARCNGCGLCSDVCEDDAIALARHARVTLDSLPYGMHHCEGCGCEFRDVKAGGDGGLCRICAATERNRLLFHVVSDL